jgi:hypothetical protein
LADPNWFHLFAVRTAQAHLDARGLRADDPGPDCPDCLRRLSLGQREALLFAERAAGSPFPAIEYLGIAQEAFEARRDRGRAACAQAREMEQPGLPPAPEAGWLETLVARIDQGLGPRQESGGTRRPLPRLPLPLAFLLAVAVSGAGVALLFRPPVSGRTKQATPLVAGLAELVPGVRVDLGPGARAVVVRSEPLVVRLESGTLTLEVAKDRTARVELAGRTFAAEEGAFVLEVTATTGRIEPRVGHGTLSTPPDLEHGVPVKGPTSWPRD